MQKLCEKCGDSFECRADNIALCHCNNVVLSNFQMDEIQKKYKNCLCKNCLNAIKKEKFPSSK